MSFSGWSLFGSAANVGAQQGLNILLNIFCGVTVNAAMGIANQVNAAVNQFVSNFQVAFRPQIVKSYAENNRVYLIELISQSSKVSFLLSFLFVCPISWNIDIILKIWLGNRVPEYASEFCNLILIFTLIESLSAPFWMLVQATGEIKKYQLSISSLMMLNIVFSYCFLMRRFSPEIILKIECCMAVSYLMLRLYFANRLIRFDVVKYVRVVILKVLSVAFVSFGTVYVSGYFLSVDTVNEFVISVIIFLLTFFSSVYLLGLSENERCFVLKYIRKCNKYFDKL